jgi:opacity protein-like surface antigen
MKKTLLALAAVIAFCFTASAADFSGKWVNDPAAAPAGGGGGGRGGGGAATYEFKVSGATLTGSISRAGRGGGDPVVTKIDDGKVTGDTFSFSVMQAGRGGGDPMKVEYTGKVAGDKLEITRTTGRGPMTTTLVKAP